MRDICNREKLSLTDANIQEIQQLYNSDIRSMINFIQLNQEINSSKNAKQIITKSVWERLLVVMREGDTTAIKIMINNISIQYNIDKKQIVRDFYNYIITDKPEICTVKMLDNIEVVIHNTECSINHLIDYFAIYGLLDVAENI
jgi:DNA polymerase III delta prime subunit